jgi:hypothetical protein
MLPMSNALSPAMHEALALVAANRVASAKQPSLCALRDRGLISLRIQWVPQSWRGRTVGYYNVDAALTDAGRAALAK